MITVTCPVALHPDGAPLRIARADALLFAETTQPPAPAAAHLLFDALGLETRSALPLGTSTDITKGAEWHFILCRIKPPVRETWRHLTPDGTLVTGRWIPLSDAGNHPALDWIRATL
ncbi:hypothetical protein KDD17_12535 [Sulfitobacter albidus]|uniref:Uncharacterized protein n=1 Tax=Sulfitobacter albidus TaxID=2829501 RepID=A0A975PM20_9RHOB|nr:hypothetical protein [Sulfitobacter albidus]QUJ75770.1 hypothetical protein KDD17_12535 [Sulfitobacter albidus]